MPRGHEKILSLPELRQKLLELNHNAEIPFSVFEKDSKLIASWKIVDAKWIELLGLGGIKKQYELILRFDEEHKQVSTRKNPQILILNSAQIIFPTKKKFGTVIARNLALVVPWGQKLMVQ
jgi:hypothetical protein